MIKDKEIQGYIFLDENAFKRENFIHRCCPGGEMADTPDLGSGAARRGGSSPFLGNVNEFFSCFLRKNPAKMLRLNRNNLLIQTSYLPI